MPYMTRTKNMELHEKDLQAVGEYVRSHLGEWLKDTEAGKAAETLRERDVAVRESLARLENGLEGQQELLHRHMDQSDKRFEEILHYMDKRFEQVDKRFESVDKRFEQVDKRFEQVDKRFEEILHYMDKRFEAVDKRFEQVDKRFEEMLHLMDKRFEQVDKRFEQVDKRFESVEKRLINIETSLRRFIYSSFSFTAAAAGLIIAVVKLA
jgi:DNA anti-recombination protein RmuC